MEPLHFSLPLSLAFDDVLLEPGYSSVLPTEVSVATRVGPLTLSVPLLSAAMDTVTEADTAISLALLGGLGVLHKNMPAEDQAAEVRRVKRFQHAVIADPVAVQVTDSIERVRQVMQETGVSGFPVLDASGRLVGMCTQRDIRYISDLKLQVGQVMSAPALSLPVGASIAQAREFFLKNKVEKLPLVNPDGQLGGLITSRDLRMAQEHPLASRDEKGSLRVAAAVGVSDNEDRRAELLVGAGADCLVIDSAHGHSAGVIQMISRLRKKYPKLPLIAGNVATASGAEALCTAGADIVKVGIGPGSICTTRIVSGIGVAQFTAVYEVARFIRSKFPQVGVIADGGIRYSGDVTKALAAGAHAVMMGSLFAGTDESPGERVLFGGRSYKLYRGMGSLGAMKQGSKDRYGQAGVKDSNKLVPEGVEARVPYKGPLKHVVEQMLGGLRAGMGYVGAADLQQLVEKARFRQITAGGLRESHVHDVAITAEAPNYSVGGES
ncbi:MAG: IMP dehydrogenase [Bdellovibrionales bacterium]|nr:IMP dehydrogenase [Bdellovibrionales bacterium]